MPDNRVLYRRLFQYLRPHWRVFALCLLIMTVYAATDPLMPALLKPFLDGSFLTQPSAESFYYPLLIVLLFVVRGILNYGSTVSLNWVAQRVMTDMRDDMFRKLVQLPTTFYDHSSAGELLSRLTYDVSQVQNTATRVVMVAFKDSLSVMILLGYLFYLHWRLALVVVCVAPAIAYTVRRVSRRLRSTSRRVQESMGAIAHVAEEAIKGHKVMRVFGGRDYETARFAQANNDTRKLNMKIIKISAMNEPVILFLIAAAIAVMVYSAMALAAQRQMTVGEFVAFFAAVSLLQAPVRRMTSLNESLQRGLAAVESIVRLVDEPPEKDTGTQTLARARGEIMFEGVTFTYPHGERPAVSEIDLHIRAGENVALVGASGGGKSTLAALLPRFYAPQSGRILLDGHDIQDCRLADLRAQIALVSQDVVLFNDTLRNNIAYGALRNTEDAAVLRAAQAARVMEFAETLPQGLHTLVGENGVRLSGGQRQRIAIARALLKDAPVLILDEATSALDTESEKYIQQAIEVLRKGRTSLIIAHRLSTIESADRIVVLNGGRIAEVGTHTELIGARGLYARLHQLHALIPASG